MLLNIKLVVDGAEIDMNDFVQVILSNTIHGAISSLREVKKDWKEIEIRLTT
jgi:hypothetical protein